MTEQSESFAQNDDDDDDDVDCIEGLQLNLELSDTSPVQTTYTPIPRPMYAEVKALHWRLDYMLATPHQLHMKYGSCEGLSTS